MKSLIDLAITVLHDMEDVVGVSTTNDIKTVISRFDDEGLSFLTITLPQFGKSLETCLKDCGVYSSAFPGFRRSGGLPRFLGGFLELIFDRTSGVLRVDANPIAIRLVRQFCLMFQKINLECAPQRVQAALDGYIDTEEAVKLSDRQRTPDMYQEFVDMATLVFGDVFASVDKAIYDGTSLPKHGPGTTQDGTTGNRKYLWSTWTERLEFLFPAREFLFPSYSHSFERELNWLSPEQEPPVRVITVPKTMKTPRIIAVEPVHMQYVQQAIAECIVKAVHEDNLSSRFISFDDQEPNQFLAHEGSVYSDLATLDLSEASDRVSNQLVRAMLARFPSLFEGIDACRSRKADVNGQVLRLAKFASMGSALCFPIETIVFVTLVFVGIQRASGRRLRRSDVLAYDGWVRAFGDDLIVPSRFAHDVVATLESFGLKVNANKSFWTGRFRESCGKEYFKGYDVSYVKVRRVLPTQSSHAPEILSLSSTRNQLQKVGYYSRTVEFIDTWLKRIIPYPRVGEFSPVVGRVDGDGIFDAKRHHRSLQHPLVKGVVVKSKIPVDPLSDSGALMKFFLRRGVEPLSLDSFERAGRPSSVRLKAGWYSSL